MSNILHDNLTHRRPPKMVVLYEESPEFGVLSGCVTPRMVFVISRRYPSLVHGKAPYDFWLFT